MPVCVHAAASLDAACQCCETMRRSSMSCVMRTNCVSHLYLASSPNGCAAMPMQCARRCVGRRRQRVTPRHAAWSGAHSESTHGLAVGVRMLLMGTSVDVADVTDVADVSVDVADADDTDADDAAAAAAIAVCSVCCCFCIPCDASCACRSVFAVCISCINTSILTCGDVLSLLLHVSCCFSSSSSCCVNCMSCGAVDECRGG